MWLLYKLFGVYCEKIPTAVQGRVAHLCNQFLNAKVLDLNASNLGGGSHTIAWAMGSMQRSPVNLSPALEMNGTKLATYQYTCLL